MLFSKADVSRSVFLGAENLLKVLFKVETLVRVPAPVGGVDFLGTTGARFVGGGGGDSLSLELEG